MSAAPRRCNTCGAALGRFQCQKQGSPNIGLWFFSCPNGRQSELCKKSFEWEIPQEKKPFGGFRSAATAASSGPTGAVAPGFGGSNLLTEATGQEILKKLDFISAQLTPGVPGNSADPMTA